MFVLSSPSKACLLCVLLVTSSSLKGRAIINTDTAHLDLPLNLTKSIPSVNEANTVNETIPPAFPLYGDGDIAWPDTAPSLLLPPLNTTSTSPELGSPSIRCNGKAYGKNLKVASCLQALSKMPQSTSAFTFGERGYGNWDAVLPYRVLSSDGLCAIDINHKANIMSDEISPMDLRQSVGLVIDICVKGKPNEGGVVSNIGKHGNLAIRVMPYKPSVRCGSPISIPLITDCKWMIDLMPVNGTKETFGQKTDIDPKITVKLPATFTTRLRRCQLFLDTLVPGVGQDTYDWYKIWAAATAIESMCLHGGRNGMAMQLGQFAEQSDSGNGRKCCNGGNSS